MRNFKSNMGIDCVHNLQWTGISTDENNIVFENMEDGIYRNSQLLDVPASQISVFVAKYASNSPLLVHGIDEDGSYTERIYPPYHWPIIDVVSTAFEDEHDSEVN